MNSRLWSAFNWLKHHSGLAAAISLKYRGALKDDGWFRSVCKTAPVDAAGEPIPWISYPALHFIGARTRRDMKVFEFGSGYSTLWWATRVRRVIACESDANWHAQVQKLAPENVQLVLGTIDEYPTIIARYPSAFDVVVIDGGDRNRAVESAVAALNPNGVIIWDDTDRHEYQSGLEFLRQRGFARIPFVGLGPVVNITKETSVLYRPGNIFAI